MIERCRDRRSVQVNNLNSLHNDVTVFKSGRMRRAKHKSYYVGNKKTIQNISPKTSRKKTNLDIIYISVDSRIILNGAFVKQSLRTNVGFKLIKAGIYGHDNEPLGTKKSEKFSTI